MNQGQRLSRVNVGSTTLSSDFVVGGTVISAFVSTLAGLMHSRCWTCSLWYSGSCRWKDVKPLERWIVSVWQRWCFVLEIFSIAGSSLCIDAEEYRC